MATLCIRVLHYANCGVPAITVYHTLATAVEFVAGRMEEYLIVKTAGDVHAYVQYASNNSDPPSSLFAIEKIDNTICTPTIFYAGSLGCTKESAASRIAATNPDYVANFSPARGLPPILASARSPITQQHGLKTALRVVAAQLSEANLAPKTSCHVAHNLGQIQITLAELTRTLGAENDFLKKAVKDKDARIAESAQKLGSVTKKLARETEMTAAEIGNLRQSLEEKGVVVMNLQRLLQKAEHDMSVEIRERDDAIADIHTLHQALAAKDKTISQLEAELQGMKDGLVATCDSALAKLFQETRESTLKALRDLVGSSGTPLQQEKKEKKEKKKEEEEEVAFAYARRKRVRAVVSDTE